MIEPKDKHGRAHKFVNHHHVNVGLYSIKRFYGAEHWNWKGGKAIGSDGYILVRCDGHPRARKQGQYVREHILVMEKHLGRYLKEGEVIHHINGDKTDNRLSNLELIINNGEHHKIHHEHKRDLKSGRFI